MIEDKILDIIVEAEHNDISLLNFYTELINNNKPDITNQLLKAFTFLEFEIEEKKHNKKIDLEDINLEFGKNHDVQAELDSLEFSVKLNRKNSKETLWGYLFPLSEKRIEKHKEAIKLALKYQTKEEFDTKHFNEVGYKLYNFLLKKYDKGDNKKINLSNIWRFMKKQHKDGNGLVIFKFTQKEYKSFVGIEILKYQITGYNYEENVEPTLQDLTSKFFKSLK